jgi:hypothetical protein
VALAVLALAPAPARAHFFLGVGPAMNGLIRPGVTVRFQTLHLSPVVVRPTFFTTFGGGYLGSNPFLPAYSGFAPWGAFGPLGGMPYGGLYNPYGLYGSSPVILPPVVIGAQPGDGGGGNAPPAPPPVAVQPPQGGRVGAPRGEAAGRFRPVGPKERERAKEPIRAEVPPPPRPAPPPFDPMVEHGALLRAGRKAFATGEYGRAAELFHQATTTAPEAGSAYFLLAQAQIALGKYPDAVATIHQGLAKQPDWPTVGPPLRELYAGDAAALAEQERLLDETAVARPDDLALDFLRAYVRWFDGRRDEARALFRKVRERVTKPEAVDRFLQAPGG